MAVPDFPYWQVEFDADGNLVDAAAADNLAAAVTDSAVADLLFFSHGWNNNPAGAKNLYDSFFGQVRNALDTTARPDLRLGTVGVFWPSMRWPDEPTPDSGTGGTAGLRDSAPLPDRELVTQLKTVFFDPEQHAALDELAQLLDQRPRDPAALQRFQQLLAPLAAVRDVEDPAEDAVDAPLLSENPEQLYLRFSDESAGSFSEGGGAGFGDPFRRLWNGAKEVLRQATYWQMKRRAGTVGQQGLGPLVTRLAAADPALRVHLIGHSFGARLVSFALAGLPDSAVGAASPVKSLLLLQGAFSHFAFADALPFAGDRGGALAGVARRVDGPLVVSYSSFDTAVGRLYPLASLAAREDAAAATDALYRWGAIGHDGAQAVSAAQDQVRAVGSPYLFERGRFTNVDCDRVIRSGGPPSGAHSDLIHAEIGWIAAEAAGLAKEAP